MIWLLALQLAVSTQQYYDSAKDDLAQLKFASASQKVDAALHEDPYFVPALILKARLGLLAHRPDIAKNCLITAVTVDPSSEEAQFFLGLFYYLQNDFKLALQPLQVARSLSSTDPMPSFYLAMSDEALGNAPEALTSYEKAETLSAANKRQHAAVLVAYGRLLYSLGRYKESVQKDRLALEADSESRDAHYEFAKALDHEGQDKNAAEEGERALTLPALGTTDEQIHFLLGNVYLKLKQPELAESHFAKFRAAPQTTKR